MFERKNGKNGSQTNVEMLESNIIVGINMYGGIHEGISICVFIVYTCKRMLKLRVYV